MKWYTLLSDSRGCIVFVKGFNTKQEAIDCLMQLLDEEPEYATFYTIRKEEDNKMIEEIED